MKIRGVLITPKAEEDLDDIWFHIASDSISRADRFLDALATRFVTLARSPRAGRARTEIALGLRSFAFRSYVIFYSLRGDGLLIERVLHGARDVSRAFPRR